MSRSSKILAIGDPHFKASNSVQTLALTREVVRTISEASPPYDAVIVLGDVLDRHDRVDVYPLMNAIDFLRQIRRALDPGAIMGVLIGNHDRPNNSHFLTDAHPFTSLSEWSDTVIADTSAVIVNVRGGAKITLVPYVPVGMFARALETAPGWGDTDIVFAHQEFRGAKLGVAKSFDGDVYPPDAPLCVSGHIHEYGSIGDNIVYAGVPFECGWSPSVKGAALLELGVGDEVSLKRVKIAGVPVNSTVICDSHEEFAALVDRARGGACFEDVIAGRALSGGKVRVKVRCDSLDEFSAHVANSRAKADSVKNGVSVAPIITPKFNTQAKTETHATIAAPTRFGARQEPFAELLVRELNSTPNPAKAGEFMRSALPNARMPIFVARARASS